MTSQLHVVNTFQILLGFNMKSKVRIQEDLLQGSSSSSFFCLFLQGIPGSKNKGNNKRSNNKKGTKSKANNRKNPKKTSGPVTGLCDLSQRLYNTMEKHREVC